MVSVPELRFKEFNEDWEEKKFSYLFEFHQTNSFPRSKLSDDKGKVCNIHYGDIHKKFPLLLDLDKWDLPFINENVDLSNIDEDSYLKEGDLLIADASEDYEDIGKAIEVKNIKDKRVLGGLHTFLARDKSNLTKKGYRGYILLNNNVKLQIKKIATGISVLGISKTNLGQIKIKFPSIEEQEKIANFLSKVDEKIAILEDKLELWNNYKKGIMQQLFSQQLRFKDENRNSYPDWEEKKLGEVMAIGKAGGTPTSTEPSFYNGNIPFLSISDMTSQGKYISETEKNITEKGLNSSSAWIISKNNLLYSIYASVGFVAINKVSMSTSQAIFGIILKKEFNLEFIYYLLNDFRKFLPKYIETGTQGNLNSKIVKNFIFMIPINEEQEKIANFLTSIDNKIDKIAIELEKMKEFKKGLLQNMFC
ncbi:MAG: restriction endonuclease subunit S [Methanobrevibacter sp.]|jgi:type I restriction enzyme S subunit|nr:restriction endonuclease subunit S [Candidatus Methanovirga australis]